MFRFQFLFLSFLSLGGGPQDSAEAVRETGEGSEEEAGGREGEENGFRGHLHGQHRRQRLLEPGSQQSSFVSVHFHGGLRGDGGW